MDDVRPAFARAARGATHDAWQPPAWLLPHQVDAARRLAGSLGAFGGAICADAVGLGKTYVGLAVATRYRRVAAAVPAILTEQWHRRAEEVGVGLTILSHESLSRGATLPRADLVIVDEAHRFRNPSSRRYRALARGIGSAHLLLLTATPVVNRAADLTALLRLFLADNRLAILGVPSLEDAEARRDHGTIALAASALIVARSHTAVAMGAMPAVTNSVVSRPPPMRQPLLGHLLEAIRRLEFPTLADRTAARLLDMHLRYRFASSLSAGRDTLRHHGRYLDGALAAARRGERLARGAASRLLAEECEGQFELDLVMHHGAALDASQIALERDRIGAILAMLAGIPESGPKVEHLRQLLVARGEKKTIVFTAAIATARAMAGMLGWRETAVVSGKGAWIASGRVTVPEALGLFAPCARGAAQPGRARRVTTLIATDLASEGLDLQDADAVVHYDLPWTPLRLEQRLGRIARLGSRHAIVDVHWFAPPLELDEGLALSRRLDGKVATQFSLGVPVSSAVGRARLQGVALEWKERLAAQSPAVDRPHYAVVRGTRAAAFAVSWRRGAVAVPEILVFEPDAPRPVRNPHRVGRVVDALLAAPVTSGPVDVGSWLSVLRGVIRNRLASAERPADDTASRHLARLIIKRAAKAAVSRRAELLDVLDRALGLLQAGVRAGALDLLREALTGRSVTDALAAWVRLETGSEAGPAEVTLHGAIFGDRSGAPFPPGPAGDMFQ